MTAATRTGNRRIHGPWTPARRTVTGSPPNLNAALGYGTRMVKSVPQNSPDRALAAQGLPAALLEAGVGGDGGDVDALHGAPEVLGDLRDHGGVVEVRPGLHDGAGADLRVLGLEDPGADEHPVAAEHHHDGGVGGRRDPAGGEVHDGDALDLLDLVEEAEEPLDGVVHGVLAEHDVRLADLGGQPLRGADLLEQRGVGGGVRLGDAQERVVVPVADLRDGGVGEARVPDRLADVPRARLALGADHRGALEPPPEGLPEVARAADEGDGDLALVDVEVGVRGGEDLGLVDHVDPDGLQGLRLGEVPDADLRHHRDGDRVHDLDDLRGVGHARDAAGGADVRRDALEGHHRHGAGLLRDGRLLRVRAVHDDAALLHLREATLQQVGTAAHLAEVEFEGHSVLPPREARGGLVM